MTYSPIIPIGQESPANQVVQVQINFAQYAAKFSALVAGIKYNHTALNSFNQGDHEAIILQKQTSDPGVTQNLDVLYCKDAVSALGTQPQLFIQIPQFLPNAIANTPMQLTYNQVNTAGPTLYQSFLPGGYLLFFGTTTNSVTPITLTPTPSSILMAIAYSSGTNVDSQVVVTQPDKVTVNTSAVGAFTFTWMAIGTA